MRYPKNRKSRVGPAAERLADSTWTEPNTGCHLWIGCVDGGGYGHFYVNGKSVKTHRFAWENRHGPVLNGLHVLHKCDTPACCNPDHLFLGTPKDNTDDKVRKGRASGGGLMGVLNNANKLSEEQVLQIRNDIRGAYLTARDYGVSARTVQAIRNRETWRHL